MEVWWDRKFRGVVGVQALREGSERHEMDVRHAANYLTNRSFVLFRRRIVVDGRKTFGQG